MKRASLAGLDAFRILDADTGEVYYGCSQDWYGDEWKRMSGCGPAAASNIFIYSWRMSSEGRMMERRDAVSFMDDVWNFVTPTERGIPTTEMLHKRVASFGESRGLRVCGVSCDIPEERDARPSCGAVEAFLLGALSHDFPVAFLNLCNGEESNLDDWHWVTIFSVEREYDDGDVTAHILDKGRLMAIDLTLWLATTRRGGGFIYFDMS
jgi:hypothetical protein